MKTNRAKTLIIGGSRMHGVSAGAAATSLHNPTEDYSWPFRWSKIPDREIDLRLASKKSAGIEAVKSAATNNGFVIKDAKMFSPPGEYQRVKLSLYVATGADMCRGYDFAGFDETGKLVAVGKECAGLRGGGWLWIDGEFGDAIQKTPLSVLWEK